MKVVVTGGGGFIGSHLTDKLISLGFEVVVIDNLSTGRQDNINPAVNFFKCDLSDSVNIPLINSEIKGSDAIFHLAAVPRVQYSFTNLLDSHKNNVESTINLLVSAQQCGIKKFIFSSSSSVYGNCHDYKISESQSPSPLSPYALQKHICEQYGKLFSEVYGIKFIALRYFNVYGDRQPTTGQYCTVLGKFNSMRSQKLPLTINNDGMQRRDFTHVADVVMANILSYQSKLENNFEVFNIGSGTNISVNEIAEYFGGETIKGDNIIEPKSTLADISKAKEVLNWHPEGDVREWIRQNRVISNKSYIK